MNYFILILVAIVGVALGMYLAQRKANTGFIFKQIAHPTSQGYEGQRKTENKQKIMEFVQEHEQIKNNDAEKLVGVSNATAERYLDELEKEGKLTQHGEIGQGVFYTAK